MECTNLRAEQDLEKAMEKAGPDGKIPRNIAQWKNCTALEMKKFIGIMFVMAINHKPEIKLYWSQSTIYKTTFFELTRDRFLNILKYLQFSNPLNLKTDDPLAKIREFADLVHKINQTVDTPGREVAIDESHEVERTISSTTIRSYEAFALWNHDHVHLRELQWIYL